MLERYPALRRALLNQWQLILAAGATAASLATVSPLPLVLWAGGQLIAMPFLVERLKKRLEIEKKYAERQAETMSQEQRFEQLSAGAKQRFIALRRVCEQIQNNYRSLSPESQGILAEQQRKFDAILATCLRQLWIVESYERIGRTADADRLAEEIGHVERAVEKPGLEPRVREAWLQNLGIKRKLLETMSSNAASREAVLAELDSLESLLQLLLQKSVATSDFAAFSAEVDDIVAQAESDAASVREMEALLGGMPELSAAAPLSDRLRTAEVPPPPIPFQAERGRARTRR